MATPLESDVRLRELERWRAEIERGATPGADARLHALENWRTDVERDMRARAITFENIAGEAGTLRRRVDELTATVADMNVADKIAAGVAAGIREDVGHRRQVRLSFSTRLIAGAVAASSLASTLYVIVAGH